MSKPLAVIGGVIVLALVGAGWWLWSAPAPESDPQMALCDRLLQECTDRGYRNCATRLRNICVQRSGDPLPATQY